jgi:hypothetical protein
MPSWKRWVLATAVAAAVAALVGAGLALGPVRAGATERDEAQIASPVKESPYARYAREHAKTAERKPIRVRASSTAHRPRGGAGMGRH